MRPPITPNNKKGANSKLMPSDTKPPLLLHLNPVECLIRSGHCDRNRVDRLRGEDVVGDHIPTVRYQICAFLQSVVFVRDAIPFNHKV